MQLLSGTGRDGMGRDRMGRLHPAAGRERRIQQEERQGNPSQTSAQKTEAQVR